VKGVGEPCAGEPHARFDGRGLETERTSVTAPAPDPTILTALGIVLLVIGTSIGLVGPAVAAPYGPHTGSATVSATRVHQGDDVRVSGESFCPSALVQVRVNGRALKTIRATAAGVASTRVVLTRLGSTTI
jgi:hypothetical protein